MSKVDALGIASESFNFLTKLFKNVGNLLLLIVLNAIPIVNFIVLGYFCRILRYDLEEPPELRAQDIGSMFVDGLKIFLAVLLYMIVPLLVFIVLASPALLLAPLGGGFMLLHLLSAAAVAIVLALAILFFALPQLAIMVRTDNFGKLFAFNEGWSLVQAFGLGNYVLLFVVLAGFNLIATAVLQGVIPYVGAAIAGVFTGAFTFKALSYLVNLKYPVPPSPPG
uniref:DUF4013 domain-containing protein n=1 Tax=Thermofilum pendens TaxID=2269 RepID=A0A7C4FFG3_THEPE